MNALRVLVTPRSMTARSSAPLALLAEHDYEVVLRPAGHQPTADELRAALPGCVGWVAGVEPVTREVLAAADRLRVISRNGAGTDAIDHAAADLRRGAWQRAEGREPQGRTLGVVGRGAIGRQVLELAGGFEGARWPATRWWTPRTPGDARARNRAT